MEDSPFSQQVCEFCGDGYDADADMDKIDGAIACEDCARYLRLKADREED